jgi:hypothetical protein
MSICSAHDCGLTVENCGSADGCSTVPLNRVGLWMRLPAVEADCGGSVEL